MDHNCFRFYFLSNMPDSTDFKGSKHNKVLKISLICCICSVLLTVILKYFPVQKKNRT